MRPRRAADGRPAAPPTTGRSEPKRCPRRTGRSPGWPRTRRSAGPVSGWWRGAIPTTSRRAITPPASGKPGQVHSDRSEVAAHRRRDRAAPGRRDGDTARAGARETGPAAGSGSTPGWSTDQSLISSFTRGATLVSSVRLHSDLASGPYVMNSTPVQIRYKPWDALADTNRQRRTVSGHVSGPPDPKPQVGHGPRTTADAHLVVRRHASRTVMPWRCWSSSRSTSSRSRSRKNSSNPAGTTRISFSPGSSPTR